MVYCCKTVRTANKIKDDLQENVRQRIGYYNIYDKTHNNNNKLNGHNKFIL